MSDDARPDTDEHRRLRGPRRADWLRWGPYLSERSWGTVREDYSADGDPWRYFPHEHARSKAYRWGEDGLAGICDRYQVLCFALALWNENDPILKERLFGLVPTEGNHGEDVKEYYFYLDSTPTHSYMKWLYKYPQAAYPYQRLIEENQRRAGRGPEYELLDTGVFDDDRYFDVFVEYAKADPEDVAILITIENRGPEPAPIHVLPHLWFRNTWAWEEERLPAPELRVGPAGPGWASVRADDGPGPGVSDLLDDYHLGPRFLYVEDDAALLFTDNDTNLQRVYGPHEHNPVPYVKDAFHDHVVHGLPAANPARVGTKSCAHIRRVVPAGGSVRVRLRLAPASAERAYPLADVDDLVARRRAEADAFYAAIHPPAASADEKHIQRQAFAGMLWTKQIYLFDVERWLEGDNPAWPPPPARAHIRNQHWRHLNSKRILSMPDKWEYPWFAAWDLAFHCVPLALVDPDFAKEQLWLLLFEQFLHPSGQIPAYEWDFSDLNPPVHAWAVWRVYNMDRIRTGRGDRDFLERCFHKLLMNFAWWVNKVDGEGNNVFEGGFLGFDNISVIDRSEPLPAGTVLEQSDATGWMGMFCLNLMRIALELAKDNPVYESLATKFFQHYIYVARAMKHRGGRDYQLWDERDGFFYDVLRYPDGHFETFRVRSLVGLVPLFAVERIEERWIEQFAEFTRDWRWFLAHRAELAADVAHRVEHADDSTLVLTIVNPEQTQRLLERMFDPAEFLSDYGLRSMSKRHESEPFRLGQREVRYEPAEADSKLKGGNSNWRGPVWFPTTFLMIESLRKLGKAYAGPDVDDQDQADFRHLAEELANRLIAIFTRDDDGRRPVYGDCARFQRDPHWRDHISFYEYFHGDDGRGLGASHQTGWSGLVASLIDEWRR
ncbi:MGH1-like glycoside hydrolase domain-containing protein [Haliangium sp.]|uniref:MGH1-like glycoside hydrolase domain-containing protein n=1 Tax=Haliangium sp. TaxID=2663208 RepID=UPI003D13F3AD